MASIREALREYAKKGPICPFCHRPVKGHQCLERPGGGWYVGKFESREDAGLCTCPEPPKIHNGRSHPLPSDELLDDEDFLVFLGQLYPGQDLRSVATVAGAPEIAHLYNLTRQAR